MNRLAKKIGILSVVFLLAIAVYFMWNQRNTEKSDVMVYTSMDEASLPVVYADIFGRKMNLLHRLCSGYGTDRIKRSPYRSSAGQEFKPGNRRL